MPPRKLSTGVSAETREPLVMASAAVRRSTAARSTGYGGRSASGPSAAAPSAARAAARRSDAITAAPSTIVIAVRFVNATHITDPDVTTVSARVANTCRDRQ